MGSLQKDFRPGLSNVYSKEQTWQSSYPLCSDKWLITLISPKKSNVIKAKLFLKVLKDIYHEER